MVTTSAASEIDWNLYVPSEQTLELEEAAREHFAALFSTAEVRAAVGREPADHLWQPVVEQGYTAIGLPESVDGLGSLVDLAAVLEQAGRALLPVPLLATAAATQTLLAIGAPVTEPPTQPSTIAVPRGAARWLGFDGRTATTSVAVDARDGGCRIRVLSVASADRRPVQGVDDSRAAVEFADAAVIDEHEVDSDCESVLAPARVCVAADLVGVAAGALDGAIGHVLTREQFGRTIGSFQAVKHLLADAYVLVERARSLTLGAAVEASTAPLGADSRRLGMLAKAAAADAAVRCSDLQVQLLGAMGLTWESDAPLFVRRARHTAAFLGNADDLYAAAGAESLTEGSAR
ncbi:acyl-CoA dehydrogenase family protein [Microbacterium immunditiarum]|uniref:Alkylation response protein AidB-like acyl-CoA dehydrogenase n=1 Tax=Microbacterium immunditiarum TaxID=337480 RepID=A0A7Y9GLZ8_9MICO|nr:acyl-CoA dehydrogenase family protein [Microbacterium immunditiarum]NYE18791.1 alkylation response protein AidB-like acyl-CoA dehydrogenase [Microbacterium immunditiarum]